MNIGEFPTTQSDIEKATEHYKQHNGLELRNVAPELQKVLTDVFLYGSDIAIAKLIRQQLRDQRETDTLIGQ